MIVVPVYNMLIVPDANVFMGTQQFKNLTGKDPETDERVVFLLCKDDISRDQVAEDSFYPIGVTGSIREVNDTGYVIMRTNERVHIDEVAIGLRHSIELTASMLGDIYDIDPDEEKKRLDKLKTRLTEFTSRFQWGAVVRSYISHWKSVAEVGAAMSMWLINTPEEKYQVLETDSLKDRNEKIERMLYEYVELSSLNSEAQDARESDYRKAYREDAIKRQMAFLQKEMDELHPEKVSDIRQFEIKISESGMNETAKAEAEKVLNRIKQEGKNSPEYGMLYDYLDFLTSLSWKKEPMEQIDLIEAEKILDEDHYGLKKVKRRILQQIAVMDLNQKQAGSILLFVGAPGTGKTSIGKSIARALGRKYARVSLGGVRDEADIRGHRRTYIGAMAGRIMDGIHKSGVNNPVMVLDEVDKIASSYHGDPASALLEVLDPEQNNTFTDHYLNVPYDLSDVMFICTANSVDTIPEPLLNRMEVIEFNGYTATEKFQIARRHLIPKALESTGIKEEMLEIGDDTLKRIISDFTMEGGVRSLKKRIDTLCRYVAVELVKNKEAVLTVKPEDLREYLDTRPVRHDHVLEKKKAGVVTGLAWTSAGGDILFIETVFTKGDGKVIITGQLGDVMKESVQIAVSLVKSAFPESAGLFKENDLHVHVPAGATPKDGPSAGITLTTAIASLVTGRAVSPEFAMTGEVSLRGVVMPIGGLPEKLMAAVRAGISKVFIPDENMDDLRDVPEEIKEQLTIIPVKGISDVLSITGIVESEGMEEVA
ncbi:MAG: endopeptidase La [Lachnospiraceae bacterium]|nr:endopeptidase La [Lachnospiraceae bacterium]